MIVDFREKPSRLIEKLQAIEIFKEQEEILPCGDILIGRFIIERKTITDLFKSLQDNRPFSQLGALKFNTHGLHC